MTLKYETELLFDLMKRGGDEYPPDVYPMKNEFCKYSRGEQ